MSYRTHLSFGYILLAPLLFRGMAEARPEPGDSVASARSRPSSAPSHATREANEPAAPSPNLSDELEELRKFEESAFPHPSPGELRSTGAHGVEGGSPESMPARPSAERPPSTLRNTKHIMMRPGVQQESPAPPEPWLAKLTLPDLPFRWDPKLIRYLEFYRNSPKGRAIMSSWLKRQGRYQKLISNALHRYGLPQDLIYVAMVESGYNPKVTSHMGAAGIWQFMPRPGRGYGLRRNHWVDERRNPDLSTEAALKYLKDLNDRFGSWELALASYNAGYASVTRAVQKYNTNDYWQLCRYEAGLPWDTALYVPKILATAIVGHNRSFFGFDDVQPDVELSYSVVSISASVTLAQAAKAAGVAKEIIEQLNPEFSRGRTPPVAKAWLRVPQGSEDRFYAGLAALKGQLARFKPYVVRLGDTEVELARSYGISVFALRKTNGLERAADLRPGLTILLPARKPAKKAEDEEKEDDEEETVLVPLAKDKPVAVPNSKRLFYRVTPGDTLEEIAAHLRVDKADLVSWNTLDLKAKLVPGMVLQVFAAKDFEESNVVLLNPNRVQTLTAGSEAFLNTYEERKGRKRIVYTARPGDTLSSIGRRFGLTVGSLMRINQVDRRAKLQPGQTIIVYAELARLRKKRSRATSPLKKKQRPKTTEVAVEESRREEPTLTQMQDSAITPDKDPQEEIRPRKRAK